MKDSLRRWFPLVDNAYATRAVEKLSTLGYVNKVQDEQDRRAYRISLTVSGRQIAERVILAVCLDAQSHGACGAGSFPVFRDLVPVGAVYPLGARPVCASAAFFHQGV